MVIFGFHFSFPIHHQTCWIMLSSEILSVKISLCPITELKIVNYIECTWYRHFHIINIIQASSHYSLRKICKIIIKVLIPMFWRIFFQLFVSMFHRLRNTLTSWVIHTMTSIFIWNFTIIVIFQYYSFVILNHDYVVQFTLPSLMRSLHFITYPYFSHHILLLIQLNLFTTSNLLFTHLNLNWYIC